jgi:hypothetical protein
VHELRLRAASKLALDARGEIAVAAGNARVV